MSDASETKNLPEHLPLYGGVMTVSEAMDHIGFGRWQIMLAPIFCSIKFLVSASIASLSLSTAAMQEEFHVSNMGRASLIMCFFGGWFLSAFMLGIVGDRLGRKFAYLFPAALFIPFGGVMTALFARSLVVADLFLVVLGAGAASCVVCTASLAEFLPSNCRGKMLILLDMPWSFGSMTEAAIAYALRPYGWRWTLGATCAPPLLLLLAWPLLPEAPVYAVLSESPMRRASALKTLQRAARLNRRPLPEGITVVPNALPGDPPTPSSGSDTDSERVSDDPPSPPLLPANVPERPDVSLNSTEEPGAAGLGAAEEGVALLQSQAALQSPGPPVSRKSYAELLGALLGNRKTLCMSAALWAIWLTISLTYYGVVFLTPEYFSVKGLPPHIMTLVSTAGELPGLVAAILLIDTLGRKWTMASFYFIATACLSLMNLPLTHVVPRTLLVFGARAPLLAVFDVLSVYTTEVYPAWVRSAGVGVCSAVAHVAAIVSPLIPYVLRSVNAHIPLIVFAALLLLAALLSLVLPRPPQHL